MVSDDPAMSLDYYPHHYHLQTRRSDSRLRGHITNGQIAEYTDDAREQVHVAIMGDAKFLPALTLAESNFRFLAEVTYPGPLTIGVGVVAIGGKSLREAAGIFRDGRCLVLARFAIVKIEEGRSISLSAEERRLAEIFSVRG